MQESYRFVVVGRVQGVGFRIATQRKAVFLGLRGWVGNRGDSTVTGEVTGTGADELEQFREWLKQGPIGAQVETLEWTASFDRIDESAFVIRR